ncbi:uncharacterized protein LOC131281831 [Anopheles ziemanni]|uniref:uncharacterized protein LOC131263699 n=1 Tax=Anopheles coustani TaxID=139045 RepID=UPI00265A1093|nr:uncharacterized protein LOC131263699 [Anopheles coustani]XP_058167170.1 uncharacterized protein LOC131281831 [Anopheles ziemanni]
MKVDKAVCTNGTLEDLNRAIQFEAVFSTLVENKILAIKRECELKKRHKKTRLLRRILFGRKVSGGAPPTGCCPGELTTNGGPTVDPESRSGTHGHNGAVSGAPSGPGCSAFGYTGGPEAALENSTISDGVDEVIVEIGDLSSLVDADGNVVVTTHADAAGSVRSGGHPVNGGCGQRAASVGRASSGSRRASDVTRGSGSVTTLPRKASLLEPVSIEIEPESDPLSVELELDSATNVSIELDGVSDVSDMRRSIASEPISIIKNSSRSRFGAGAQHGPFLSAGHAANRLRVLEAKSISAQNSPILPRQKPAAEGRHLTFSTATYQQPASTKACTIDCDTSFVVDLSQSSGHQHQHHSTVIVKDKSAAGTGGQNGGRKSASLALGDNSSSSSASKRNKLSQHLATRGTTQGADGTAGPPPLPPPSSSSSPPPLGLIESFNQLTASNLPVISAKMHSARQSPPVSDTVKLQQQQQQHHRRPSSSVTLLPGDDASSHTQQHPDTHSPLALRKASCSSAGAATEDQALLKTPTQPQLPTGAAHLPQQQSQRKQQQRSFLRQSSCDVELHYRPTVCVGGNRRSSAKEHHHHHRKSSGYGCHGDDYSSYIMGYDINESDEEKLNKRKYKYLKRCSDPVIVFPSTSSGAGAAGGGGSGGSGLQHCILSRPPNQPLQFPYDDDFMYDVSLQIESDRHGELDSIVPEHRRKHKHSRHHHHHHRHCKKKRHKKRKILVHDLDDQSVKVIDPDDLPQRARWTIIATACLLLIMCLLLVGITLRMAPIIDDMVRQENERLMRESLDRAKMIKNYTEYNRMIGGDEIP